MPSKAPIVLVRREKLMFPVHGDLEKIVFLFLILMVEAETSSNYGDARPPLAAVRQPLAKGLDLAVTASTELLSLCCHI